MSNHLHGVYTKIVPCREVYCNVPLHVSQRVYYWRFYCDRYMHIDLYTDSRFLRGLGATCRLLVQCINTLRF